MIEFLQKLFLGHVHKWKIINQGVIVSDGQKIGDYYHLRCEHCGDVKVRNLR